MIRGPIVGRGPICKALCYDYNKFHDLRRRGLKVYKRTKQGPWILNPRDLDDFLEQDRKAYAEAPEG